MNNISPGYKQTEAGVIPEDWKVKIIDELASVGAGGTPSRKKPEYWDGPIPWITTSQIDFGMIAEADQFITEDGLENSATKLLPAGTLLLALYGQGKTRGKVGLLGFEAATNQACASISIRGDVSREFLLHFLISRYEVIRNSSNSGSQENLNGQLVKNIQVALPPTKAEQEAIAEVLSDTDALIESLEQLIAKKRHLKQGTMQELLTGKKRLPGFGIDDDAAIVGATGRSPLPNVPHGWEVKRLGDILSRMANGAVYNQSNSLGIPITRIETISDGTIDYSRTGNVEPSLELDKFKMITGDILFSHINSLDHIGKVAQLLEQKDLYHGMNLLLLRANNDTNCRFLYFWFTSVAVRKKLRNLAKQAVSQASINTTELKELEISVPPLPEQTAIATILSDMDAEIASLETKLAKTRQLKQGMMHNLLTGRIRLL